MTTNVLTAIMAVFEAVIEWIVGAVETVTPMFYGTDGLTFLGLLGVASLAFSVAFLSRKNGDLFLREDKKTALISGTPS